MLMFPDIDPVAIQIGSFKIYWYGITYLVGFLMAYMVAVYRGKILQTWNAAQVSDLLFYFAIGVIIGGRAGYVLLYQPEEILNNPFTLLAFWERGRSFHGGLLGVLVSLAVFCKIYKFCIEYLFLVCHRVLNILFKKSRSLWLKTIRAFILLPILNTVP